MKLPRRSGAHQGALWGLAATDELAPAHRRRYIAAGDVPPRLNVPVFLLVRY